VLGPLDVTDHDRHVVEVFDHDPSSPRPYSPTAWHLTAWCWHRRPWPVSFVAKENVPLNLPLNIHGGTGIPPQKYFISRRSNKSTRTPPPIAIKIHSAFLSHLTTEPGRIVLRSSAITCSGYRKPSGSEENFTARRPRRSATRLPGAAPRQSAANLLLAWLAPHHSPYCGATNCTLSYPTPISQKRRMAL